MESKDETIPEFEFSEEELMEALRKKGGRPSNRTRELRERLQEAQEITDIIGILRSGVLERLLPKDSLVLDKDKKVDQKQPTPEGFTADLLKRTGLVDNKFLETNKEILKLTDGMVQQSLVTYGPPIIAIVGGLAGLWIAESQIKSMPKLLHTYYGISIQLLRLTDVLASFFSTGLGGLLDVISDPIGNVISPAQEAVADIFNLARTPEEKAKRDKEFQEKLELEAFEFRGGG